MLRENCALAKKVALNQPLDTAVAVGPLPPMQNRVIGVPQNVRSGTQRPVVDIVFLAALECDTGTNGLVEFRQFARTARDVRTYWRQHLPGNGP